MTVSHVIFEIAFVIASISFDPSAFAFTAAIFKLSLQEVSIVKVQFPISVGFVFIHLADIFGIKMSHVFLLIVLWVVVSRLDAGKSAQSGENSIVLDF